MVSIYQFEKILISVKVSHQYKLSLENVFNKQI